jgi:hypothetical protein
MPENVAGQASDIQRIAFLIDPWDIPWGFGAKRRKSGSVLVLRIPAYGGYMRWMAATLVIATTLGAMAEGQEVTVTFSAYVPLGVDDLDGRLPHSAEVRLTVPISDRFAIEPFATVGSHSRRIEDAEGFYGVQIRQRIRKSQSKNGFAFTSYGVTAYYSRFDSDSPIIGQIGFGLHHRVAPHLAFRPELQLVTFTVVPIGVRFVAGLSLHGGP